MLSPGKRHQLIPRNLLANLRFRQDLLKRCHHSDAFRRLVMKTCQEDILFFVNCFVYQFNPKKPIIDRVGPFITYPFQEDGLVGNRGILWCYEHQRTSVVEKSREMGASWLFLIFQVWLCLFFPRTKTLNISRNEDAVDCADPDSLFWKVRFIHQYLPEWMTGKIVTQKLFFEYKRTGSYLTGEATTSAASVGGRAGVVFVDEFPRIREAQELRQGTASTTDCRFFNGTHQGTDTEFYRLTKTPEIIKHQWHWTKHPEKNRGLYRMHEGKVDVLDRSFPFPDDHFFVMDGTPTGGPYPGLRSPWYDKKCADIGNARAVAMELDIDAQGSVWQVFDPILMRELRSGSRIPSWEGDLEFDRASGMPGRLVRRTGGPLRLWITPDGYGRLPAGDYAFGADIATGMGASPSCLSGMECTKGRKVIEYVDAKIEPIRFAELAVAMCRLCRSDDDGARLAWEIPGPGLTFGKRVSELGYSNIYRRVVENSWSQTQADIPGWMNTPQALQDLIENYRNALTTRKLENLSDAALAECAQFRYAKGATGYIEHAEYAARDNPAGARVSHGDIVIADAIMWLVGKGRQVKPEPLPAPEPINPYSSLEGRIKHHERLVALVERWD